MECTWVPAPGKDGEERVTCVGCGTRDLLVVSLQKKIINNKYIIRVFKPVVINSSCSAADYN